MVQTMNIVKLAIGHAGYCTAPGHIAVKGDPRGDIRFYAMFAVITHAEHGYILFDTGYTDRFYQATATWPNKLYAIMTKVYINEQETVKTQLEACGIRCEEIKHVIISHFHADHIGGLLDFPNAKIYCSEEALQHTMELSGITAFRHGILKDLIPSDIKERVVLLDSDIISKTHLDFGLEYDLFDDGSILLYPLPGHAAGQIGIRVRTEAQGYFLVADAAWDIRAITESKLPNSIIRLFIADWAALKTTISSIQSHSAKHPQEVIVPTHCSTTTNRFVTKLF